MKRGTEFDERLKRQWVFASILVGDFFIKRYLMQGASFGYQVFNGFLQLNVSINRGVWEGVDTPVFVVLGFALSAGIIFWAWTRAARLTYALSILVLASVGNGLDWTMYRGVVDYIVIHKLEFNFTDVVIILMMLQLLIDLYKEHADMRKTRMG